jgi:predicted nuclease of predicted toxin-antitoxin system
MPGVRRRAGAPSPEYPGWLSSRSKRLFDENLAVRLVAALADLYPGPAHVSDVGLAPASDHVIWTHAREHGFVIVSKDEDFHRLSVLLGPPPKVIWICRGNCSTNDAIRLLRLRHGEIEGFVEHEEAAFLALA